MVVITITGAESTGKSTLAAQLAEHYNADLVSEYSRSYLANLNQAYGEEDLLAIAKGQLTSEKEALAKHAKVLICDTSLLVMKVWGLYKYGKSDPWINDQLSLRKCELYILPHYDIPYEEDPLRENPEDRNVLYDMYVSELNKSKLPYLPVSGSPTQRLAQSISAIDQYILSLI